MTQIPRLALFDLDNTIIAGDSDFLWGQFLVEKKLIATEHFLEKQRYFYRQYLQYKLDVVKYLQFVQQTYLAIDSKRLPELQNEFVKNIIVPLTKPKLEKLIVYHYRQGHTIIVISASADFIIAPICVQALQITHYIGALIKAIDGTFASCMGEQKYLRLQQWLAHRNLPPSLIASATFYSDSFNDYPLLLKVQNPVVVDGDEKLRRHALANNWQLIDTSTDLLDCENA